MNNNQPPQQPAEPTYGVLFLPELVSGAAQQHEIMLPLTLTYLLSMHISFYLPVASASVGMVESVFDQVLNGHTLRSKGVIYLASLDEQALAGLLGKSSLVITTDSGSGPKAPFSKLPQALVCYVDGKIQSVQLRNTEQLQDQELKAKLVGCSQLINIQAGGFITQGHFSLSW